MSFFHNEDNRNKIVNVWTPALSRQWRDYNKHSPLNNAIPPLSKSRCFYSSLFLTQICITKMYYFLTHNHKMTTILFSINFSSSKTWHHRRTCIHITNEYSCIHWYNQTTFNSVFIYSSPFVSYTLVSRFQWMKRSYLVKFRIFNVSPMMMSKALAKSTASYAIWWR